MERPRGFPRRFRFPSRSTAQIRRDVDDELAFHLAEKTDALERQGLTRDDAREEALRQFGDMDYARERLIAEDHRGERRSVRLGMLDDLARDVRLAWRSLWRTPAFTVVAVLVLALGIGVVSGASSIFNALALKPVMMEAPDEVLGVFAMHSEPRSFRAFSYPEYVELRERVATLSSIAAFDIADAGVEEDGVTRRAQTSFVSANYFETFGVPLARGRSFTLAEERGDEPAVAVVSHDVWARNGADPAFLGSVIRVNGEPLTVVGIARRGFTGTMLVATDVWVPLASAERILGVDGGGSNGVDSGNSGNAVNSGNGGDSGNGAESVEPGGLRDARDRSLLLFGRLADGTSSIEAEAELAAIAGSIDANLPDSNGDRYTYIVGDLGRLSYGTSPNPDDGMAQDLALPTAMSVVVLLIACLNLANMFLARGASRRTEMAIRQSLGSGRARLMRQLLTEGLLLAMLGGIAGLIWSYWVTSVLAASLAEAVPLGFTVVLDTRPDVQVLLVTAAACVIATLLFGLGPAWRVTGTDVLGGLKEGAGFVRFQARRHRARPSGRNLLLVGQIALSLAMLAAGGLFVRSALVAANALPSFDLDSTLVVELDPSLDGRDEARSRALYAQVLERVRSLPGVEHAGMTSLVPLAGITHSRTVQQAGLPPRENAHGTLHSIISDGYFDTLGLPIFRGRDFTQQEVAAGTSRGVAIIDEPLARRLFPESDALGRLIQLASRGPDEDPTIMEIVGIAPGTPGPGFDPAPTSHLYTPFGQTYSANMSLLVGASERADAAALLETIRREIRGVDASLPVLTLTTMRQTREENWSLWLVRMGGRLFMLLGVLALFVAMVGLYGVKAFLMSRRTREIGVRMALGATRRGVLRQMMRESMTLTVTGLAVGLVLALVTGRILSSLLYRVSPSDPWAFIGATVFLALAAAVASWLPMRTALRIEPSAALRYE